MKKRKGEGHMKLEGKIAIVTGSGRGLGRSIALCLAEEGAAVVVVSLHQETADQVAAEIKSRGGRSLALAHNVTKREEIVPIVKASFDTFGRIDILVNNAGGATSGQPGGTDPLAQLEAEFDANYELNIKPTVFMSKIISPYFIKQKSGKIVNIASVAGRFAFAPIIPVVYGSMKAALIRYTQSLANSLGPHNINVNCVCPGIIYTDAWQKGARSIVEKMPQYKGLDPRVWFTNLLEGKYPDLVAATPLRREQTPEDIGRAVVFLVSEDARNITGQALNVDGGLVKD
jgi:meso-butanediol dehydrogenase/(S,S)-butanediol dehydrogenase/diacetyl reductase